MVNDKDPKFKVGDHVRISKYKNICAKGYTPNWSEKAFVISKIKNTVPWTYFINNPNGEEIINYMSNGKVMIIHLITGLIKRVSVILLNEIPLYKMSQYFPKPYEPFVGDMDVKVDLSNYATKPDIENISHVDSSSFALKTN